MEHCVVKTYGLIYLAIFSPITCKGCFPKAYRSQDTLATLFYAVIPVCCIAVDKIAHSISKGLGKPPMFQEPFDDFIESLHS
jgi:hypothetical protein